MPKRKRLLPLTPRAREVVNFVINSVALGTHDDEAESGVIAQRIGTTPARLHTILHKLQGQDWLTVKSDFVYPTVEAVRWQNPALDDRAARKVLRAVR